MVIVYRAFSAHFCTVFVARLLLSDFRSERSWRKFTMVDYDLR